MPDIFVSYAHEDELRVRPIVHCLELQGWRVFWDRTIPIGKTWHSFIEQALLESHCILVAWSSHSVRSEWVIEEAEYAKQKGILVPLLLDAIEPPFGFKRIQTANISSWNNDATHQQFQQCLVAIAAIIQAAFAVSDILQDKPNFAAGRPPESKVMFHPFFDKSLTLTNFVLIRGDEFVMGSPESDAEHSSDETQHEVRLNNFYMSRYTVTVASFSRFIEESGYRTDADKDGGSGIWDDIEDEFVRKSGINWCYGVSGQLKWTPAGRQKVAEFKLVT